MSTEPRDGGGRTFLALEDVELLALGGPDGAARLGRDQGPGEGAGAAGAAGRSAGRDWARATGARQVSPSSLTL